MVYYLTWEEAPPAVPSDWERMLPSDRVAKAKQYKHEKDRSLCVWSFLLLRYALHCEYGTKTMPQWKYEQNGKPTAVSGNYCFNISHCDRAVACIVDQAAVGIDVQDYRAVSEDVVQKVCSENEITALSNCKDPKELFSAFWASKEAYGKRSGQGIGYELKAQSFCSEGSFPWKFSFSDCVVKTFLLDRFALSFCARQDMQMIAVRQNQLQEFFMFL